MTILTIESSSLLSSRAILSIDMCLLENNITEKPACWKLVKAPLLSTSDCMSPIKITDMGQRLEISLSSFVRIFQERSLGNSELLLVSQAILRDRNEIKACKISAFHQR
jgi:hypothetical protein